MSFSKSAHLYDRIYSWKNYEKETEDIIRLIRLHIKSDGNRLLDIACGTGRHIEYLKPVFSVEGMDLDAGLLEAARRRNPDIVFHQADMTDFYFEREYDILTCLFSSIGYIKTIENLHKAVRCFQKHMAAGGVLILEPWFTPSTWKPNTVHALFIDDPELKIARISTSGAEGALSWFDLHYLVGTPKGTEHFIEHHELGLFSEKDMLSAFTEAGLDVIYDPDGLTGRGLYIATSSSHA
jgi:SAM-dependent methyltransferase